MAPSYMLQTGEAGKQRLAYLNEAFGPSSDRLFESAGVRSGSIVADIGCGSGTVTLMLARRVGPSGHVFAVDSSEAQLAVARENADREGLSNITFHCATANDTGLPNEALDFAYCRFVLVHLKDPRGALREMMRITKRGGVVAAEEPDMRQRFCEPEHESFTRYLDLLQALSKHRSQDPFIGRSLHRDFMAVGLRAPEVNLIYLTMLRGHGKRVIDMTITESAAAMVEAGLATGEELVALADTLRRLAADESVMFGMSVYQVWCVKDE